MTSEAEAKLDARIRPEITVLRSRTSYPRRHRPALAVLPGGAEQGPGECAPGPQAADAVRHDRAVGQDDGAPGPGRAAPAAEPAATVKPSSAAGRRTVLRRTELRRTEVRRTEVREAGVRRAEVRRAEVREAEVREAEVREAEVRSAAVRSAAVRSAAVRSAAVSGAELLGDGARGAGLRGPGLRGAVLRGAELRRTGGQGRAAGRVRLTRRGRVVIGVLAAVAVSAVAGLIWLAVAGQAQAAGHVRPGSPAAQGMARVVVRPGDSLWSIAAKADPAADPRVVIQQIMDDNALSGTAISAGQVLWVPRG